MIRVHRLENEPWGRAHLPYFRTFDKYLKNYFDFELVKYEEGKRLNLCVDLPLFGSNAPITDVEYIIKNNKLKKIKIFSFTEYFNHILCHYAKSDHVDTILLAHYSHHHVYDWCKSNNNLQDINKIKPFIFLPYAEYDAEKYRGERVNDKLFFLGSGLGDYRKTIKIIDDKGYLISNETLGHTQYLEELSKQKVALSHYLDLHKIVDGFTHPGEFCYRDIEYMSLGIPFIRIEFRDCTHDPFIPNKHYIPILREKAYLTYEKYGDEGLADLYIEKYNEVINETDYLEYISKNQIEWYDRNIKSPNAEKLTFNLLKLNEWL